MKRIVMVLLVVMVLAVLASCTSAPTTTTMTTTTTTMTSASTTAMMTSESAMAANYMDVSPMEAKNLIDSEPDLMIIDVSPAYANGHLPGAVNYYVGDGSLDEAIPTLDQDKPYLVYCHNDSASILGAQKLIDAGFKTVYRLEGNYSAWVDAGYDIEK